MPFSYLGNRQKYPLDGAEDSAGNLQSLFVKSYSLGTTFLEHFAAELRKA